MPNIVQSAPRGMTAIQVEHIGVSISSLPLDWVVIWQERVRQKSSEKFKTVINVKILFNNSL